MSARPDFVAALEAVLFVAGDPVPEERLLSIFDEGERNEAAGALAELRERYRTQEGRGVFLEEVAGGLRIVTAPEMHPYLKRHFEAAGGNRLSMAALESLAVVAYRQPVTGPEVQELRGKNSTTALKTLLERRMIRILGRKEVVGRPFIYGTTRDFLQHFGLRSLDDLPPLEEFEEALGIEEELGTVEARDISPEHESIGLVSTGEAEAALGTAGYAVLDRVEERADPGPGEAVPDEVSEQAEIGVPVAPGEDSP